MTGFMRRRAFALLVVVVFAFAAIFVRLGDIQVLSAHAYTAYGQSEYTRVVALPGLRGAIFDRRGQALALSEQAATVVADPYQIAHPHQEAAALAPLIGQPAATIASELARPTGYVVVASNVTSAVAAAVRRLNLAGITMPPAAERFYPAAPLAAPLLGQIDAAGNGSSGLEYAYNRYLTGHPGRLVERVDPQGRQIPGGTIVDQPARLGDDLVLSLDESLQYQTEQVLGQAIVASHARGGIAMVMDTRTGGLLAVADLSERASGAHGHPALPVLIGPAGQILAPGQSTPTAQPVESVSADAFTHVYEPGSVEKLITVSAALADQAITPGEIFDIPSSYLVDGIPIHDAENHGNETLSVTGILAQSSNIGAAQIAQHLGAPALYRYMSAFGLGAPTPVGFPGESAGLLPAASSLSAVGLSTLAYGEGMAVTAAQMLAAYNTIANGGIYVAPHLVKDLIGPHGTLRPLPEPAPRRVVPPAVAQEMTSMLEQVVSAGTGTAAAVAPYAVAGKTGTAQYHGARGYVIGQTVASFAGYAPAQKPAVTVMVVIDHTPGYGAQAAAPAFAAITRDALFDLRVGPAGPQPPPAATAQPH